MSKIPPLSALFAGRYLNKIVDNILSTIKFLSLIGLIGYVIKLFIEPSKSEIQ